MLKLVIPFGFVILDIINSTDISSSGSVSGHNWGDPWTLYKQANGFERSVDTDICKIKVIPEPNWIGLNARLSTWQP